MRIENLRREDRPDGTRVLATVVWEQSGRGRQDIYFGVPRAFADALSINPQAFLVACVLPAMRHGEKRVAVDADVCPELVQGLETAMRLMHFWYGQARQPVAIEAGVQLTAPEHETPRRSAFCFTGGVDSLCTLLVNRFNFPASHPGYFRDGVLIFGLEVEQPEAFQCVVETLGTLAEEADVTLLPVHTNVRTLNEEWAFWGDEFEAAALASAAHALGGRIGSLAVGSSFDYPHLHPHGSHPLLDSNYSSSDVRVSHDGAALSRLEKIRLLAGWDVAVNSLRVCNRSDLYQPGVTNCGRCEKCLRTLLAFRVAGRQSAIATFAQSDVTPDLIAAHVRLSKTSAPFWAELAEPLQELGLEDLARAVHRVLARHRAKGGVRRAIRRLGPPQMNSALSTLTQTLKRSVRRPHG